MRIKKILLLYFFTFLTVLGPNLFVFGETAMDWFDKACSETSASKQVKYFNKALEEDPGFYLAYKNRGMAYDKKGDFDKAALDFSKMIELKPNEPEGYFLRSDLKKKKGDLSGALDDYSFGMDLTSQQNTSERSLRESDPLKEEEVPLEKVTVDINQAPNQDEASLEKPKPQEIIPDSKPQGEFSGGGEMAKKPSSQEEVPLLALAQPVALAQPEEPAATQPVVPEPHTVDSEKATPLDKPQLSEELTSASQPKSSPTESLPEGETTSNLKKAESFKQKSDYDNALIYYRKVLMLDPKNITAFSGQAEVKCARGLHSEAIKDYDEAIRLDPQNPFLYNQRGKARKWVGDKEGAVQDYRKSLELNPNLAEAWNNLGWMKYNKGELKDSIKDFDKAIELDPDFASAYNSRGFAKEDSGDQKGAEADFQKYRTLISNVS